MTALDRVIRQLSRSFVFHSKRTKFDRLRTILFRRHLAHYAMNGTLPAKKVFKPIVNKRLVHVHISRGPSSAICLCRCPDGLCEHVWDGPVEESDTEGGGFYSSATCGKCGMSAMSHDMWCGP